MVGKALRWLLLAFAILFMADEALPILEPWRGNQAQWLAVLATAVIATFAVALLLTAINTFMFWRLGGGDIKRGKGILEARKARRRSRGKA